MRLSGGDAAGVVARYEDGENYAVAWLDRASNSLVTDAVRNGRGRSVLLVGGKDEGGPTEALQALLLNLIDYARVTVVEEEEWSSDPNAFVMASDEDGIEYGLRVACADMVQDLLEEHPKSTVQGLARAFAQATDASSHRGWKGLEAALAVVGGVGEMVQDILQKSPSTTQYFDLGAIFQSAVLPSAQSQSHPLLTGRAYIFASQFAATLPREMAQQFVDAAVQALEAEALGSAEETLIIKLSAVRCIKKWVQREEADQIR